MREGSGSRAASSVISNMVRSVSCRHDRVAAKREVEPVGGARKLADAGVPPPAMMCSHCSEHVGRMLLHYTCKMAGSMFGIGTSQAQEPLP